MFLLSLGVAHAAPAGPAPMPIAPWFAAAHATFATLVSDEPRTTTISEVWSAPVREGSGTWIYQERDTGRARHALTEQGLVSARSDLFGAPLPLDGSELLVLPAILRAGDRFGVGAEGNCTISASQRGPTLLDVHCVFARFHLEQTDTYDPERGLVGRVVTSTRGGSPQVSWLTDVEPWGGGTLDRWTRDTHERTTPGPLRPDPRWAGAWRTDDGDTGLVLASDGTFAIGVAVSGSVGVSTGVWGVRDGVVVLHPNLQHRPLAAFGDAVGLVGAETEVVVALADPTGSADLHVDAVYADGRTASLATGPFRFPSVGLERVAVRVRDLPAVERPVSAADLGRQLPVTVDLGAASLDDRPIERLLLRPEGDRLVTVPDAERSFLRDP